ncbi:acyltransferase family protein [Kitasatospora sp. CB01950]|uniref:acyltransferase family protein n=1 Tax=Kitasatospora sp. CB01950 TaxID=1703930 RepID=UPI00093EB701|nr:acyltransferase family protein [Kitasatospora sp. CB01950]OKJ05291.1 acyltransferase [Kitasatospora sp. CB01950]
MSTSTAPLTVVLGQPPVERPKFRPDIEGLRAVAVLAVLAFHAAVPGLAGGFVGVDVFFVISGYLITGLLRSESAATGKVRLAEFYSRRARRLLPSAAVVLAVVAVLGALLTAPLRRADLERDVLASALSVANWRFIAEQTDYLAAGRDPSVLLHFWSLAVEEQFYLLWAPLMALAARWVWKRRTLLGLTLLLGAGSFWLSLHWSAGAYLSTPTRAWQFAAGAVIALLPIRQVPRLIRELLGLGGMVAVLAAVLLFDARTPYPGYAALLPTVGTAAIVLAGSGTHLVGRVLSLGAPRAIGRLSYNLYLWHWPVLVLAEAQWGALHWGVKVALTAAAALPALAALHWLEQPLRRSLVLGEIPRRGLSLGLTAVVMPVVLALVVGSGTLRNLGPSTPPDPAGLPPGARDGRTLLAAAPPANGPTVPNPVQARQDFPPDGLCEVNPADTTSPPCRFGNGDDRIVLLGDSHAGQWFSAMLGVAAQHRLSVEELVKQGCPLPELTVNNPQLGRTYHECDTWRTNALARLKDGPKPKLIVVSTMNRYTADRETLLHGWEQTLTPLRELGVPIVYLQDTPIPGRDVPACVSGHPDTTSACDFPRSEGLWADPLAEEITAGRVPGVRTVGVNQVLCPGDGRTCPAVLEHVLLYRDDSHLTNAAAVVLTARLDQLLTEAGLFGDGWTTLLHDEFDGPAGTKPDPANWQYDLGTCYPGCPAPQWGTGEIETMTDSTANVRLDGQGSLEIVPTRDASGHWSSGRIESKRADFAAPAGGVLRVEAKLALPAVNGPAAAGYWPAFWALGGKLRDGYTGWPGVGELDVLESVGGRGAFGTMHCGTTPNGPCKEPNGLGSGEQPCADCWGAFHTWTIEVDRTSATEKVRWLRDGQEYFAVTSDQVEPAAWDQAVHHGIFLILNVAIGGNLPAAHGSSPTTATEPGHPMKVASVTVSTKR